MDKKSNTFFHQINVIKLTNSNSIRLNKKSHRRLFTFTVVPKHDRQKRDKLSAEWMYKNETTVVGSQ